MKYTIVTGSYNSGKPEPKMASLTALRFRELWLDNTVKYSKPESIYLIAPSEEKPESYSRDYYDSGIPCNYISVNNLGHLDNMPHTQQLTGWSASFLMGCLLSYHNKTDLIYKEQDCLAFGPWVERLYQEIGASGMITGQHNVGSSPIGDCDGLLAQSLVLVKHRYLLPFLAAYLSIPETDKQMLNEEKFDLIRQRDGEIVQTTMGYDRTRPINYGDEAFYAQHISAQELQELQARGLV